MTRENKISLLVGLAFILVVGILLSDHMTTTIEPASASLQNAGPNLRSGLGQPSSDEDATSNVPLAADTARVTPREPVPTSEELSPRPKPVAIAAPPVTLMGQNPVAASTNSGQPPVELAQVAHRGGEDLVSDPAPQQDDATVPVRMTAASTPRTLRSYKAQPGDSLSKMAARFLGQNTRTNRDLIVAANHSLQDDPDKIIVGHTYTIPVTAPKAAPVRAIAKSTDDDQADAPAVPAAPASGRQTSEPISVYTVKAGDTLWKIAVNQLGDADTVAAIEELNQDVLKGAARIHPNMKLRLPVKPIAAAN